MSFVNPIDYTGFSSPFRADLVANNRNMAEAKKRAGNYLRAGEIGGLGASQYGQAVGQGFLDDAGAYAAAQQRGANMFSKFANVAGMVGGLGAQGAFGNNFDKFFNPNSYGGTGSTGITTPGKYGSFNPGSVNADLTKYFGAPSI